MKNLVGTGLFLGALFLAFIWLTETELFSMDIRFNFQSEYGATLGDRSPTADREIEQARWSPDPDTLLLAAAGATKVLGHDHSATMALAVHNGLAAGP